MNMRPTISYEEQLKAAHRARQMREAKLTLAAKRAAAPRRPAIPTPAPKPDKEPIYRPIFSTYTPLWLKEDIKFNEHEIHRRKWIAEGNRLSSSPLRLYIRDRAGELGFGYKEITGPSRATILVLCRHVIVWEVKNLMAPKITLPELGRLFNRDHTTVLYALRRIDRLKRTGELSAHTMPVLHREAATSAHAGTILEFLRVFIGADGHAPTAEQIAAHMGWTSTASVYSALYLLESRRKIKRLSRKVHELELV